LPYRPATNPEMQAEFCCLTTRATFASSPRASCENEYRSNIDGKEIEVTGRGAFDGSENAQALSQPYWSNID
jgi:hypothetical protein